MVDFILKGHGPLKTKKTIKRRSYQDMDGTKTSNGVTEKLIRGQISIKMDILFKCSS